MTIRINNDSIELDGFTLSETADGFNFGGRIAASSFIDTLPFQGHVSGYVSGGSAPPGPFNVNTIDKFPFASDGSATDVGDLTQARSGPAGQSSTVSGYTSGGDAPPSVNTIDKFPFAADGNATDVGDLTQARYFAAGQSSTVSGYTSGGFTPGNVNTIDKFPFASDGNATDVGDLTQARTSSVGQQV